MKKYLSCIGITKTTNTYQFIERLKVRTVLILKFALETLRKVKIGGQTMPDGSKKKPLPDRCKANLALTTPHRATVNYVFTVLSHYQSDKRWLFGINNLSPSFTPKASYQASMWGKAPFTRHLPRACGSAFVRLRISCSVMFCPQTAA